MPWPNFLRKNRPPHPKQRSSNVVFFTADARYLQLAWLNACAAAAEQGRNFDVVLLTLAGAKACPAPPGCLMVEITLPDWVGTWPVPAHMSLANYARLFAADEWLRGWDRALYLDSDILITGALSPLFELNLHGALAALVEDCGFCRRDGAAAEERIQLLEQIGLDPGIPYFNAGVMLFDAAAWRLARVTADLARFKDVQHRLSGSVDQDFVNWVVRGRSMLLSPRWNFQTHYFGLELEPVIAPVITHYLDILKPWRDPEWGQVYDMVHATRFARFLATDAPFGPGPSPALSLRAHPDAIFATHVANILYERPQIGGSVRKRIAATAKDFADLTIDERGIWAGL